jgi:predicted transcriptional regulator
MSEAVKVLIAKWENIDDEISEIQKRMKELKKMKEEITDPIKQFMITEKLDSVQLPECKGFLRIKSKVKYASINQEYIKETLNSFFSSAVRTNDPETLASESTEMIMNNRESEEVHVINRTKK